MKTFRIFNAIISGIFLISLAMSCGSHEPINNIPTDKPDDETPNNPEYPTDKPYEPAPNPEDAIIDFNGERLSSIGKSSVYKFTIEYNDDFVEKITEGNPSGYHYKYFTINYPNGEYNIDDTDSYHTFKGTFSFNERGFIDHLERYRSYAEGGITFVSELRDTIKYDFHYTDDEFLKSYHYEYITVEEGYSSYKGDYYYKDVSNTDADLTWENNNLVRVTFTDTTLKPNGEITDSEWYCHIDYSSDNNTYRQIPLLVSEYAFNLDYPINILASIGLFGKGSEMLPSSIIYDISPSDWRETELQLTFELNENGSIMCERYDDNRVIGRYIYEYIPLSEMTTSK